MTFWVESMLFDEASPKEKAPLKPLLSQSEGFPADKTSEFKTECATSSACLRSSKKDTCEKIELLVLKKIISAKMNTRIAIIKSGEKNCPLEFKQPPNNLNY